MAYSIVIEGLDGVGKTTVCKSLSQKLNAALIKTPPIGISQFRQYFDSLGGDKRTGYYLTGNFLAGEELRKSVEEEGKIIVCDRYYPSTISYILGQQNLNEPIPSPNAKPSMYEFPKELYRPNYLILLCVDEDTRLERRCKRKELDETLEESNLRQNRMIGERINEAYRHFGCVEISAKGSAEEIADLIIAHIRSNPIASGNA